VEAPSLQEGLLDPANTMLQKLVGSDGNTSMAKAAAHHMAVQQWQDMQHEYQAAWPPARLLGVAAPTCQAMAAPQPYQQALAAHPTDTAEARKAKLVATALLEDIRQHCQRDPALQPHPFASMGGAMQVAWQRHAQLTQTLAAQQQQSTALVAQYKEALKAYQQCLGADPTSMADTTRQALSKLRKAAKALDQTQNALSAQFMAQQRLDSLNDFVAATTTGLEEGLPATQDHQAVLALVLFPKLIDDANAALRQARTPLALPLLIQRDQAQLALELTNREVASLQAQVRLSQLAVDATYVQARQLWLALSEFDAAKAEGVDPAKPTLAAFGTGSATAKASMYRGAGLYLDAINRLEARRFKVEHQLTAASDELRLAYAEVNAKQWASLISASVEQVATAGAAGIKAERVSALLNTAGVLYIGKGVNQ